MVIKDFPQPSPLRALQEILSLLKFHRHFIPGCAHLLQPLTDLLRGREPRSPVLQWNDAATNGFTAANQALYKSASSPSGGRANRSHVEFIFLGLRRRL